MTWQGWRAPAVGRGWIDCSHVLRATMPRISYFAAPTIRKIRSLPDDPLNLTEVQFVCHVGTHVDAPSHFIGDGPGIDEVPLERLIGEAVVWRIDSDPEQAIGAERLEQCEPRARPGDMVLLDTGWARHFGDPLYDRHPFLSPGAAAWLVEHDIALVGLDLPTPDLPTGLRPPGFDWPVHHLLLGAGVLIVEHLTNLRPVSGQRVEALVLPLAVEGADGSPARVLLRPLTVPSPTGVTP